MQSAPDRSQAPLLIYARELDAMNDRESEIRGDVELFRADQHLQTESLLFDPGSSVVTVRGLSALTDGIRGRLDKLVAYPVKVVLVDPTVDILEVRLKFRKSGDPELSDRRGCEDPLRLYRGRRGCPFWRGETCVPDRQPLPEGG